MRFTVSLLFSDWPFEPNPTIPVNTAIPPCVLLPFVAVSATSNEMVWTTGWPELLKLSAEVDPRTGCPFIASKDRALIQAKLQIAIRDSRNIALLRHNELAHISAILSLPEIGRIKAKARREIGPYIERCLDIFADITLAGYSRRLDFPDFDREINEDLEVLLTVYLNLRGASG